MVAEDEAQHQTDTSGQAHEDTDQDRHPAGARHHPGGPLCQFFDITGEPSKSLSVWASLMACPSMSLLKYTKTSRPRALTGPAGPARVGRPACRLQAPERAGGC